MFLTRIQGRSSGETLATAELLAAAAAAEGRAAAASTAGHGVALCTIGGRATARGSQPQVADALIVEDPGELGRAGTFARLSPEAYLLVNSTCGFGDLGVGKSVARFCRDRALILPVARLEPNLHEAAIRSSSLVGGFAALSRLVSLDSVISAVQGGEPDSPVGRCAEAAAAAYEFVRAERVALAA